MTSLGSIPIQILASLNTIKTKFNCHSMVIFQPLGYPLLAARVFFALSHSCQKEFWQK